LSPPEKNMALKTKNTKERYKASVFFASEKVRISPKIKRVRKKGLVKRYKKYLSKIILKTR
ncbi:unnamed protein product, partial [marine sediment metagenome]